MIGTIVLKEDRHDNLNRQRSVFWMGCDVHSVNVKIYKAVKKKIIKIHEKRVKAGEPGEL